MKFNEKQIMFDTIVIGIDANYDQIIALCKDDKYPIPSKPIEDWNSPMKKIAENMWVEHLNAQFPNLPTLEIARMEKACFDGIKSEILRYKSPLIRMNPKASIELPTKDQICRNVMRTMLRSFVLDGTLDVLI